MSVSPPSGAFTYYYYVLVSLFCAVENLKLICGTNLSGHNSCLCCSAMVVSQPSPQNDLNVLQNDHDECISNEENKSHNIKVIKSLCFEVLHCNVSYKVYLE